MFTRLIRIPHAVRLPATIGCFSQKGAHGIQWIMASTVSRFPIRSFSSRMTGAAAHQQREMMENEWVLKGFFISSFQTAQRPSSETNYILQKEYLEKAKANDLAIVIERQGESFSYDEVGVLLSLPLVAVTADRRHYREEQQEWKAAGKYVVENKREGDRKAVAESQQEAQAGGAPERVQKGVFGGCRLSPPHSSPAKPSLELPHHRRHRPLLHDSERQGAVPADSPERGEDPFAESLLARCPLCLPLPQVSTSASSRRWAT